MDNKTIILQKALQLFSSRGYAAVGVQEIAVQSGITKPTLYHYFGSKSGLLTELLERYFSRLNQSVLKAADYQGDLPLTIHRIAREYFSFAMENKDFYRMHLAIYFAPPDSPEAIIVSDMLLEQYKIVENMFEQAVKDHGNMRGRSKAYAATLIGMLNTYIGLIFHKRIEMTDELIFRAVHQFMHGIYS